VSFAEIKASIDQMTDEERFFATAYLHHKALDRDPAYQMVLSDRMRRMDAGNKVSLEQAQRIHQAMEAEGL